MFKRKKAVGLTKRRALYGYLFILPFILGASGELVLSLCSKQLNNQLIRILIARMDTYFTLL